MYAFAALLTLLLIVLGFGGTAAMLASRRTALLSLLMDEPATPPRLAHAV